jgi:uncharacterized protein with HEPN domain
VTRDRARLLEILDAIARIERYTAAGERAFRDDDLVQSAVLYRVGSIGESVKGLSSAFRERHPEVQWRQIAGIRDIVAHRYFGVDLGTIWATVERDLPALKAAVSTMLASDPVVRE